MIEDQELTKLQKLFSKVDITDPKCLRKWFDSYPHLSVNDHAIIMNKCTARVRHLRALCGLKGKAPTTTKRTQQIPFRIGDVPENWRTKEWLQANIDKYGREAVARSVQLSSVRLSRIMDKLGVQGRGSKSRNPNCTRAWCHRHYVELQMSENQCAKLAGITRARFSDWLVKFRIPTRPTNIKQDCNIQLKFFFKVLINKLKADPNVKEVRIGKNHLAIKHQDGLISRYRFSKMDQEDWKLEKVPPIINQYNNDIVQGQSAHIAINRRQLMNCTIIERDIALHRFNKIITSRGWIRPEFPIDELNKDMYRLRREKESNYVRKGCFTLLHNNCPGRRILTHFFDMSHVYNQVLRRTKKTYRILYKLYQSKNNEFDLFNVIRMVTRLNFKDYKFKMPNPFFYATILKRLNIKGNVLDLHVGTGSRSMACALNGLHYMHLNDEGFMEAVKLGYADFMGLKHSVYSGQVDLVIADIDLTGDNCEDMIKQAFRYAKYTKRIMAYVPKELKDELYSKYKPSSMLKCVTHPVDRQPNYLFIW